MSITFPLSDSPTSVYPVAGKVLRQIVADLNELEGYRWANFHKPKKEDNKKEGDDL